jgi:hypothetical protein
LPPGQWLHEFKVTAENGEIIEEQGGHGTHGSMGYDVRLLDHSRSRKRRYFDLPLRARCRRM